MVETKNTHGNISAEEQKIVDSVDSYTNEAIDLLEKAVNIESPTENPAGVKQVGMLFRQQFESLGFAVKWIEMPEEMKRAGHLLAEKEGKKGKRVLLLGHLDTVLKGEKFRRDGDRAFGTGIYDMKAGVVVLCAALKALQAVGALENAGITVLLTGDEEAAGTPLEISRAELLESAEMSDLALCFEFGRGDRAIVARRGSSKWQLEVTAESGHSSGIFRQNAGSGAIFEAARIVNQFYEALHGEKYLTFNPSIIAGGTEIEIEDESVTAVGKLNVIPAKVIVRGDLRFISEQQKESARAKMTEIVSGNLPGASAKITFADGIPAMPPTDENYALLKQFDAISQDLGFGRVEAYDPGERGAGDISYVAHLIPGLDGLGATGGGAHVCGEYIDLTALSEQTKRVAVLIYRLIQQD